MFVQNRKTSQMTYAENIMNKNNIRRVRSRSIILLIFMGDILFLYTCNGGGFIFIIHHLVCYTSLNYPYLNIECGKRL